ncbi:MAG: sugar phosphate isomerase/epimerase family protein [Aestuariibacter sp.]
MEKALDNPIGVMQGRLLPKYQGRYQAHPVGYWQNEFEIAAALGLDCIEFILDDNDIESHPLMTRSGLAEISEVIESSGVNIYSICADNFMVAPLHKGSDLSKQKALNTFEQLLQGAKTLGVSDIVIPCVDHTSLLESNECDAFIEVLRPMARSAQECRVRLSLETDLPPASFAALLASIGNDSVKVNYDIGNSAALGYDYREELTAYGSEISDIHVKDRLLGAGPVVLGTGNADIPGFFEVLKEYDYHGPIIMQAYRDDEGIEVFKKQLTWLRDILEKHFD